jgi:hypothetical protein
MAILKKRRENVEEARRKISRQAARSPFAGDLYQSERPHLFLSYANIWAHPPGFCLEKKCNKQLKG